MTVREKMNDLLGGNPDLIDCGEFNLDFRPHGILQNLRNGNIVTVYKSKDDIDDNGNPITKVMTYENLKDFFDDFPPSY